MQELVPSDLMPHPEGGRRDILIEESRKKNLAKAGGRNVKDNSQLEHRAERCWGQGAGCPAEVFSVAWGSSHFLKKNELFVDWGCCRQYNSTQKTSLENWYHQPLKISVPFIGSDDKGCL